MNYPSLESRVLMIDTGGVVYRIKIISSVFLQMFFTQISFHQCLILLFSLKKIFQSESMNSCRFGGFNDSKLSGFHGDTEQRKGSFLPRILCFVW